MRMTFDIVYVTKPSPREPVIHSGLKMETTFPDGTEVFQHTLAERLARQVEEVLNHPDAPPLPPEGATITITRRYE